MAFMKAVVRYRFEGWHKWPDAEGHRAYLASKHRHIFHVEVQMELKHDDREVEFHDLKDDAIKVTRIGEMGAMSCEQIALEIIDGLSRIDRYAERSMTVSVFEDGEVGAIVTNDPPF